MSDFSKNLKMLRKEKGYSQQGMSNLCGISRDTISNLEIERVAPDVQTLRTLADFFDVSVDFLVGKTPIRKDTSSEFADYEYVKSLLISNGIISENRDLTKDEFEALIKKIGDIYKLIK